MKKKTIPAKKLHAYIRAAIQVVFFICFPSAFTTAFSAIKSIFTQIGSQAPIAWSSFLTVCLALCAFTIVFGRFFCVKMLLIAEKAVVKADGKHIKNTT